MIIVNGQIQEMDLIRNKIFQLEQVQTNMKNEYVPLATQAFADVVLTLTSQI